MNGEAIWPAMLPGAASMIAEPSTPSNLITFCWLARPLKRTSFQVPVPAFCEPGACSISCDIWRPFTGRFSTSRSVTLTPMRAELRSIAVALPLTVTASVTPAAWRVRSSGNSCAAASCTPVYSTGAKPWTVTLMV